MTVLKFEMSGREFAFDSALEVTADDLWALDELGVPWTDIDVVLQRQPRSDDAVRAVRVFCALAYLSARRVDPSTTWPRFARTIAPATLKVLGVEPSGLGAALAADDDKQTQEPEEPAAEEPKPSRAPKVKKQPEKAEEPAPVPERV